MWSLKRRAYQCAVLGSRLRDFLGAHSVVSSERVTLEDTIGSPRCFPAGISGAELTGRAVTQARKFGARTATPYRALSIEPGSERHVVRLEDSYEVGARAVVLAT